VHFIDAWVDTDFAGCRKTRKSTSGGVLRLGEHLVKGWSQTQAIIALSSGEAEYYGLVRGSSEALGLRSVLGDLGVDVKVRVKTDASAAKGIATRRGLGKVRHIEVHQLWLQEKVTAGEIEVIKVPRAENRADALTHPVDPAEVNLHLELTVQVLETGRNALAPKVEVGEEVEVSQLVFRKGPRSCASLLKVSEGY